MNKSNFIDFKKVSVIRDEKKILNDINLSIGIDENTAIIGPNGSGKSTFIKLITGKIYPSYTGDDTICSIFGNTRWNVFDLRSLLGIVTNELQYDFHNNITGSQAVMSGFFASIGLFSNHKISKEMKIKAEEKIDMLEVSHLSNRTLETMSSGEARRFLIARALVNDPKVLVLDEPSNSLDIASVIKFHQLIRKIASAQKTKIILVTHFISDIIPEISRFVLLKDGKIFADGKREETFTASKLSELFNLNVDLLEKEGISQIVLK
jgi:iron complex transport system ATP-binding protein